MNVWHIIILFVGFVFVYLIKAQTDQKHAASNRNRELYSTMHATLIDAIQPTNQS